MTSLRPSVWLDEARAALPRVLALFDDNPASRTRGLGDRYHWAWKLIDFANGTYQGAAHGWARLLVAGALPEGVSENDLVRRTVLAIEAAGRIRRADGSCEEAFPWESSFCVTALVAYDLLAATDLLSDRAPGLGDAALRTVAPMVRFLERADERHGLISNHLATAVAALVRWYDRTGEASAEARARILLERILAHRSVEGWFREYEGADPGYQTLAMDYLTDVHALRPDWGLAGPLADGCRFLALAAHPDGSFGGPIGSRNTRFYAPGGLARLAAGDPVAAALDGAMQAAVSRRATIPLAAFDDSNLIPFFNSYVRAATAPAATAAGVLPCDEPAPRDWVLPEAGWRVSHRPSAWTIVSTARGGAFVQVPRDGGRALVSGGVLARDADGAPWGSQTAGPAREITVEEGAIELEVGLLPIGQMLPTPLRFVLLRLANLTVMRWRPAAEWVKRLLVALLVTRSGRVRVRARRRIDLVQGGVDDALPDGAPLKLDPPQPYSAIHMASQGYWQRGDGA